MLGELLKVFETKKKQFNNCHLVDAIPVDIYKAGRPLMTENVVIDLFESNLRMHL